MEAASTQSARALLLEPARRWYRRSWILLIAAMGAGYVLWTNGIFDSNWVKQLTERVTGKPPAMLVTQTTLPPVEIIPPAPIGNDASTSAMPMPLILTGTMPGRNAREGLAFIGIDETSPQTYAAGAILANQARVAEIHTDRVVLERDGKRVDLYLHGTGKTSDIKQLANLLTVGGTPPSPPAKATSQEVLTDYIRPSPFYDGHVLRGYQVYAGQRAGVFFQMGLQAGDIIRSLNGVALVEPNSAVEQLKLFAQGYAMTATVERQGSVETLSLDGTLVTADQERLRNPPVDTGMSMPPM